MDSENQKKIFSIAAPTVNLRNRGRGYESKMYAEYTRRVNVPILPYVCAHKSAFTAKVV